MKPFSVRYRLLATVLAASLAVSPVSAQWGSTLPDLGDSSQDILSPAMERKIGEAAWRDFRANDPSYVHDAEVEEYVNRLGRRLVPAGGEQEQAFRFFVLEDKTINAFAMPGGFIGVHTGLIIASQTESEFASVLAHEVAHVTQHHIARSLANQGMSTAAMLASMVVGILAARSNPQAAAGALSAGTAFAMEQSLSYTRDFEREADRIGFQSLSNAGFDTNGMPSFFERLAQANRLSDFSVPSYLRTHPLTSDRINDMQGRARQSPPGKARTDSLEYQLVRAKLDANTGAPAEALKRVEARSKGNEAEQAAQIYELARIRLRERNFAQADAAMTRLAAFKLSNPMLDQLAADIAVARGEPAQAIRICHDAQGRFPGVRSLVLCEAEAALAASQPELALRVVEPLLSSGKREVALYELQAKAYAAQGNSFQQQRAQAEVYYLNGNLASAVEQLKLAQLSGAGDYFEQTAVDARLRELRARLREEMLERRQQGGSGRLAP